MPESFKLLYKKGQIDPKETGGSTCRNDAIFSNYHKNNF
jgi:hypothetical protein